MHDAARQLVRNSGKIVIAHQVCLMQDVRAHLPVWHARSDAIACVVRSLNATGKSFECMGCLFHHMLLPFLFHLSHDGPRGSRERFMLVPRG